MKSRKLLARVRRLLGKLGNLFQLAPGEGYAGDTDYSGAFVHIGPESQDGPVIEDTDQEEEGG